VLIREIRVKTFMPYQRKTWREKLADDKGLPKLGKVNGRMRKTWGTGTMVIPAPREVDAAIRKIRKGRTATINDLRATLAKKHGVNICCPITTGIFAWIAAVIDDGQADAKLKELAQ
jgi:hypothetical protein